MPTRVSGPSVIALRPGAGIGSCQRLHDRPPSIRRRLDLSPVFLHEPCGVWSPALTRGAARGESRVGVQGAHGVTATLLMGGRWGVAPPLRARRKSRGRNAPASAADARCGGVGGWARRLPRRQAGGGPAAAPGLNTVGPLVFRRRGRATGGRTPPPAREGRRPGVPEGSIPGGHTAAPSTARGLRRVQHLQSRLGRAHRAVERAARPRLGVRACDAGPGPVSGGALTPRVREGQPAGGAGPGLAPAPQRDALAASSPHRQRRRPPCRRHTQLCDKALPNP
jgi:hypothetical protein